MNHEEETTLPIIYLKPGEAHVSETPSLVKTVLGSCISVTFFSRRHKVGAICHAMLPECRKDKSCGESCGNSFKYVDCALEKLLATLRAKGISGRGELEVKLFGGADMFTVHEKDRKRLTVGRQNLVVASRILERAGLTPAVSDVGGIFGRKLFFYTHTGEVLLKRLNRSDIETEAN